MSTSCTKGSSRTSGSTAAEVTCPLRLPGCAARRSATHLSVQYARNKPGAGSDGGGVHEMRGTRN